MAGVEGLAAAGASTSTVDDVRRRVQELRDAYCRCMEEIPSNADRPSSEDLLVRCALEIERGIRNILPDLFVLGDVGADDLDALRGHLEEELNVIDTEKVQLSEAMKDLTNSILADSNALESKLEEVEFSMDLLASLAFEEERDLTGDPWNWLNLDMSQNFEILELQSQIEKKEIILNSLQHISADQMKYDIIEQIENAFSDVKIIDTFGNSIRLSLSTFVPKFGGSVVNADDIADSLKMDHEMLIALGDGNVGLSSVEIFPNDVFIGDIVDTAMSFRDPFPRWNTRQSPLEWLVRKTQDRIRLATLRRLAAKNASKASYTTEYMDKEGTMDVQMTSGVDVVIKVPQDWPLSDSPLMLASMHVSDSYSRRVSENHFSKIQEAANFIDALRRRSLSTFLDDIEKMLNKECT